MRLWSLHPKYFDAKGLVALWREALLAQKVLLGQTKGYSNHPQLVRFKNTEAPMAAIGCYLKFVEHEAVQRGYHFDRSKILQVEGEVSINVNNKQLDYESAHLFNKLKQRDPQRLLSLKNEKKLMVHPMFKTVEGAIEFWEKTK